MPGPENAIEWDEQTFQAAVKRAAAEGVIDARGVRLDTERLNQLLAAAPKDSRDPGRPILREADFQGVTFEGDADFTAIFEGDASFFHATFGGDAAFGGATFEGDARFSGATFAGIAGFGKATFGGDAVFVGAAFTRDAYFGDFGGDTFFGDATFGGHAGFGDTTFGGYAGFGAAIFGGYAGFGNATFGGYAEFGGATFGGYAEFGGATFGGNADFGAATFGGYAEFGGATFGGTARFDGMTLEDDAQFGRARFDVPPSFRAARFKRRAKFGEVRFGRPAPSRARGAKPAPACFDEVIFGGRASFERARFFSRAEFGGERGARFAEWAVFKQVRFVGDAMFGGVNFADRAMFGQAQVYGRLARFDGATFARARTFGPLQVRGSLILDRAQFEGPVRIEVVAAVVSGVRAHFSSRATIFVRWADVQLDEAQFDAPALVGGASAPFGDSREAGVAAGVRPGVTELPRVVSLRWAKVNELVVSHVDLRSCRFLGAHGLDGLRLEHVTFAQPPPGWRRRWGVPWTRWTRRQTVAEENHWRAQHGYGASWYQSDVRAPDWLEQASEPPEPEQIAGTYRDLRKGREDSKDEPGAADFYYGEMEMRRHSQSRGLHAKNPSGRSVSPAERWILWLYWLVAGYGLRASRALVALALTIALLGAIPLDLWGFRPDRSYGRALLFSLESSISLLRAPEAKLTAGGEVIQIALRLAGPLFFGLALLSLRGRVKR